MAKHLKSTGFMFDWAAIKAGIFNSVLNAGIGFLVSAGLQFVIGLIDDYVHRVDNAKDVLDKFDSEIETRKNTYKSHAELIDKVSKSYDNLASKVDTETNLNLGLSEEEYSEFLNLTNEIADAFPTLVKGFDESGNAILDFGDDCSDTTEKLKELLETERQLTNVKIASELPEYFKNTETVIEDYDKQITQFKGKLDELNNTKVLLDDIISGKIDLLGEQNKFSVEELGAEQFSELHNLLNKSLSEFVNGLSNVEKLNLGNLNLGVTDLFHSDGQDMWLDLVGIDGDLKTRLESIIKDNVNMLSLTVNDELSNAQMSLNQAESSKESSWKDFTQNLVAGMNSKASFQALSAEGQQLATALVQGLNSDVDKEMSDQDPYKYVQDNIIAPLSSLNENDAKAVSDSYKKLLTLNPNDLSEINQSTIDSLLKSLAQILGKEENELRISLGFEINEDFKAKYDDAIKEATKKLGIDKTATEGIFTELGIDTTVEIDRWNKVTAGINDATEAKKAYLSEGKNTNKTATFTEQLTQIQALSKGFEQLDSIMADVKDGKEFNYSSILGNEDFTKVFGEYTEEYENFIKTISNSPDDISKCKSAFDELATAYVYGSGALSNLTEESKNAAILDLEQMGISNAAEIVENALNKYSEALRIAELESVDLANATLKDIENLLKSEHVIDGSAESLLYYAIQKELASENGISTGDECQQLINLANQALETGEVLSKLVSIFNVLNGTKNVKWGEKTKELAMKELQNMLTDFGKMEVKNYSGGSKTSSIDSKQTQKEVDIMAELNSEMDEYQSKLEAVKSARETYNEYGKITVDQAQDIIDADFKLLAAYGDEEEALERLGKAKLNEMQIQLARNALDTINSITSEAMAADYLAGANENLAKSYESVTEAMLQNAVLRAKDRGALQYEAAQTILKGYQNGAMMLGQVDFGFNLQEAEKSKKEQKTMLDIFNEERRYLEHLQKMDKINNKEFYDRLKELAEKYLSGNEEYQDELWGVEEEVHDYLESIKKEYNWIEKLLESTSKKVNSIIDKAEKFISWQKKNLMINRAVKETDKEITQNQNAYNFYMDKANSVGLSNKYKNKIQNGELNIEEIADEELSEKIEKYEEWYEKAQSVNDTINELYDQERDLIRQKLDNVINYYHDMDSYLSSITSKVESLINLNERMGKRSSLTDLIKQFSDMSAQLSNVTESTSEFKKDVTEINFGESESVKDAIAKDKQEQIDAINAQIENLTLSDETSGTYKKLSDKIAKKEAEIEKYENKGWDETKSKKYDKLWAELDDLYDLQAELDANATTNTIKNYEKVYLAYRKLQKKIDSGKELKPSEQKKYDSYWEQLDNMSYEGFSEVQDLKHQLGILEGTISPETDVEKAQREYDSVQENLENSGTYKKLEQDIEKTEKKLEKLDDIGFDNLTKKQKATYNKLTATLEDYYDRKKALDENATADNVVEYNKIYIAWKKLQDRLDSGKNLNPEQWKNYEKYTKQLKQFEEAKHSLVSDLETQLEEAKNPSDKLETIEKEYEKSAKGIYDSYQKQIEGVKGAVEETKQYQNLLAKARQLEKKKDKKGLTKQEENRLNKLNAKLEALREGGTTENLTDYISTWEKLYKLEQNIKKNGKLSDADAKNYDTYKAKLEAWNKEKQQQISDLTSLMEDELEALQKTYVENVSEAESQISEYYANLYDLAKKIAEYNLGTLEEQLALLDSYISYYQQIVDLYSKFSDDKLAKILSDFGEIVEGQDELYAGYLEKLQSKYDTTLSKINEYKELLGALDKDNFEGNMALFQSLKETYIAEGKEDEANDLQKVLDLLNERAVDANNWGEYADQWKNEWEKALADAKTELIGIAGSIQDVNDQLREIKFSNITGAITELSNAQDMLSSIVGLINDDWMFNADGDLTQYGLTKVGLLVEQMEQAKQEANKYAELIQSIESMRNTYASEDAYEQAMHEAKMNYLTSLGDLQNYQDSIVSILTKADEAVVDSLKDVIEKRKEALRKKKELYDYDKSIKSSQKEIDSIKAQIHALESLSDTTDAATKAKLAQLNADLLEKEEALKETKDEHTYNLQIDALDEFLESLNDTMNNTTDSINKSFETYIEAINSALKIYGENKEWLNDWSNEVLDTVTGMGNTVGGSGVDLDVSSKDTPTVVSETGKIASDDIHFYGTGKNENIQKLIDYFTNNSVLVRAEESPLLTANPEMMQFMQNYVPQMAVSVNHTIPEMMRNREQVVNNFNYDCILKVEGNVDKEVARLLPQQLEQAFQYTAKKFYREQNILGNNRVVR